MIAYDGKYVMLNMPAVQRLISERIPEFWHGLQTDVRGLNVSTWKTYFENYPDRKRVEMSTALNVCNALDCRICDIIETDGRLSHARWHSHLDGAPLQEGLEPLMGNLPDALLDAAKTLSSAGATSVGLHDAVRDVTHYLVDIVSRDAKMRPHADILAHALLSLASCSNLDDRAYSRSYIWQALNDSWHHLGLLDLPANAPGALKDAMTALIYARANLSDMDTERALRSFANWLTDHWRLIQQERAAYVALECILELLQPNNLTVTMRHQIVRATNMFCGQIFVYGSSRIYPFDPSL